MFDLPSIPVTFPEKEIFLRLNGNLTRTKLSAEEKILYLCRAKEAFELCHPAGRWNYFPVKSVSPEGIMLADNRIIPGKDFAAVCTGITHLWCGAVTVGKVVTDSGKEKNAVSIQTIYDAAASETADAAMDLLTQIARRNLLRIGLNMDERRYSPGYGDMPLSLQKFFFDSLQLEELDMSFNENFYMLPEKSVTAFAGIRVVKE